MRAANPAVDQLLAAVEQSERQRGDNGHLVNDGFIGSAVERIMCEYGPATECVDLRMRGAQRRIPAATGLRGSWALRWVARLDIEYKLDGDFNTVIDVVVPLRDVTICDRCSKKREPRWVLLLPTPPNHLVFLVCDGCRACLDDNFSPICWDPYVD